MELDWNNEKVQEALHQLSLRGFSPDDIKDYSEKLILQCVVPTAPVQAAILLHAAERHKKSEEEKRIQVQEEVIAERFIPFVGRVRCEFEDGITTGSCVLAGPHGLTITTRHGIFEEKKGTKGKKKLVNPLKITVSYPNAIFSNGNVDYVEFVALIRNEDAVEDMVILAPINDLDRDPKYFSEWSTGVRKACTRVMLISYPDIMDKEFPGRKLKDLPTCDCGTIVLVTQRRTISTYRSFAGSSGGLVLKVDTEDGLHGVGIHLATVHDTNLLKRWSEDQLGLLNSSLSKKACYGVASRSAGYYIETFFEKQGNDLKGSQLQRAARVLERPSLSGAAPSSDFLTEVVNDSLLLGEVEYEDNWMMEDGMVETLKRRSLDQGELSSRPAKQLHIGG